MSKRLVSIFMVAAACGGSDSPPAVDGPPVAQTIQVSGTAEELSASGSNPVADLLVEAFANSADTTVVASAMTDASGNYTLTIETNGQALDGFIKATKTGLVDTYLYPPEPLTDDFAGASLNMVSPTTFGLLADTLCRANQDAAKGTIAILVNDSADMPVSGATVSSSPAAPTACYNGSNGLPSSTATATAADGVGYLFNVTGNATVSATASTGGPFRSHQVNARAGALTTTLIQP
jgi:hypothetical protein